MWLELVLYLFFTTAHGCSVDGVIKILLEETWQGAGSSAATLLPSTEAATFFSLKQMLSINSPVDLYLMSQLNTKYRIPKMGSLKPI